MTVLDYQAYLHSGTWAVKRELALHRAGKRCERCGAKGSLDVHHKTYDRLGQELPEDLEVLCRTCHEKADVERHLATERRRLDGWATKVYGEDWADLVDSDVAAERFQDWLEDQV